MSRKTYSLSAAAIAVAASLSFSSADGAIAFAQDAPTEGQAEVNTEQEAQDTIELMPETTFVSDPVVQDITEHEIASEIGDIGEASSLLELVGLVSDKAPLTEELRCLAGAVYFESRGEPLAGQLAVAQVVINRSEDGRWPASYCGVVLQPAQFSFVRSGRLPRVNTSSAAWDRAQAVARIAHDGLWESEAGEAVYFHANYVRPGWSRSKTRLTEIDSHVFYR